MSVNDVKIFLQKYGKKCARQLKQEGHPYRAAALSGAIRAINTIIREIHKKKPPKKKKKK